MVLYLSGNFPQLSKVEKELTMAKRIIDMGLEYHRLMTFFYRKDCETILTVRRTAYESGQEGITREIIRTKTGIS